MNKNLKISGLHFNYYFICKRKLWFYSRNIEMEKNSDLVAIGKVIDEKTFVREKKNILIDNTINIDFVESELIINEVKKSNKMEKADLLQIKYYLYYLKQKGVDNLSGTIRYPKLRKKLFVELNNGDIKEIKDILKEIKSILKMKTAPKIKKTKVCKKCSYYELCFI